MNVPIPETDSTAAPSPGAFHDDALSSAPLDRAPRAAGESRPPSLIDVEVLDLGPLYEQAVDHYVGQAPERAIWGADKRARLRIRTECRWGRVQLSEDACFLLNERGEGPREPLSGETRAYVALYAEMVPGAGDPGFFESEPFCKVLIDHATAATFRSLGLVALEDFIRAKMPEMEAVYDTWLGVLREARLRAKAARVRARA